MSNPIMVSGLHRSGSTWIGRMIALSREVHYIDESFTPSRNHLNSPISTWLTDLSTCDSKTQEKATYYLRKIAYNKTYNFQNNFLNLRRFTPIMYGKTFITNLNDFLSVGKRPLFKDPMGLMSTEWMEQHFKTNVIISVRHPAAFISSNLSLGWGFNPSDLLHQKKLIQQYLYPLKGEMEDVIQPEVDILTQNILAYRVLIHRIIQYKAQHPSWLFIRYEDLVNDPENGFQKLFQYLNLPFDDNIRDKFNKNASKKVSTSALTKQSYQQAKSWKKNLEPAVIKRIKEETSPYWQAFYTEEDW